MGFGQYCEKMFNDSFAFWTQKAVTEECSKPMKSCAQMNEQVFKNYRKVERGVLQQLIDVSNAELQKKEEKE